MPLTRIVSRGITDGTIVDADINASAAIDASKLTGLSSDYVLLATTSASNSASVSFDGYFSSTYKNYKIIVSYMVPAGEQHLRLRYRRSNADITTSNYNWLVTSARLESDDGIANASSGDFNGSYIGINPQQLNVSDATAQGGVCCDITLYDPLQTNHYKWVTFNVANISSDDDTTRTGAGGGILRDSAAALSGVSFSMTSGNITSGNFKLYGIK